ncbi:glycine zipper domain-containing protein [Caballeronia sp. LZ035]|uniref:DUF883 family protein n=1 Tax=Caballeronia sp. LZ035 TaxID=3038568 RepID=UPI00286313AF|nr:hypothetical protein [Caballeronia sp. LZ035]MDR5763411.1 hypothetical protein [Caballeronia sp. LZ035]
MTDPDRTHDPVDALKTERANSVYEFPTSESVAAGERNAPGNSDDHGFRDASQSWDAGHDGSSTADARANAKARLIGLQDAMNRKYRVAADTTDDFVHDNPWKAITLAALAGFVTGMLVSR